MMAGFLFVGIAAAASLVMLIFLLFENGWRWPGFGRRRLTIRGTSPRIRTERETWAQWWDRGWRG